MSYLLVAAAWSYVMYLGYSDWKSVPGVLEPVNKILVNGGV